MIRIANGSIVDGTGKAAFRGDIVLEGDRIAAVEPVAPDAPPTTGPDVVDAAGCVVTPGLISVPARARAAAVICPARRMSSISCGDLMTIRSFCPADTFRRNGFGVMRFTPPRL